MAGPDRRTPIRRLLAEAVEGNRVVANGWVKTSRFSKNVSFVHLFDGSTPKTLQVVLDAETDEAITSRLGVGAAVRVEGRWVSSPGAEQALEILAESIDIVGDSDATAYPIRKSGKKSKGISLDTLRDIMRSTTRVTSMVFLILIGASIFALVFRGYGGDEVVRA
ncbi:MAG: OB-fold nucleic acid binding domain-containing protein, partial [Myxococcota bacterium]